MLTKIKVRIAQILQIVLYFVPIKDNRILFYANNRKGYVCNPAALMETLLACEPKRYELIWVTRFPETCERRNDITVVRQRSLSYFLYFLRARYFITNDMIDEALVKKKGQIFLTTWHGGGAYKKVGKMTCGEDDGFAENFKKWYGRLDYFVSSCRVCTDMYADAFGLDRRIFLETGTPRNDVFFRNYSDRVQKVRDFYRLPDHTRILLFAPSFQMSDPDAEQYDIHALAHIVSTLREDTGESWIILYRCHYFLEQGDSFSETVLDGNAYYEMQDLLCAADLLVTDFSSCIWDFALTGRPVILLEKRLIDYEKKDRGFFIPYEKWPYLRCPSPEELPAVIEQYKDEDFSSAYASHLKEMGSFEQGDACQSILKHLGLWL